MSLRDHWEQETSVVIVTCLGIRPGVRGILEGNAILHRIDVKYFFGFDHMSHGGIALPVSDQEKTLIDLIYYGESSGSDALGRLAKAADESKLCEYLMQYLRGSGQLSNRPFHDSSWRWWPVFVATLGWRDAKVVPSGIDSFPAPPLRERVVTGPPP